MPRLVAKVEGKGNGIKTVIANMTEIAKALHRPPTYPTKYFGCELGAQTQFDLKNDRYIVNGEHDAQKLQEILDGFIKKFVLCAECENPETMLNPPDADIPETASVTNASVVKRGRSKKAKDNGSSSPTENGNAENGEVDDLANVSVHMICILNSFSNRFK
ncbi:unnamed protein product [Soboliphyme baturini]|uniref:Eukaryotic translation initiation factor 5 n=1 Tax=Soboliphyme baturini TaxID=241478 RepID=A0A183J6F8_9BILA|nr:unnamed protein product [Soboliphyme baturini]